jgi:hypothetical protein
MGITANNTPSHHQLQTTRTLQQDWPLHRELDLAAGRERMIGFK